MNAIARRRRQSEGAPLPGSVAGADLLFDPAGALLLVDSRTLIVSDLHLETGAAFARRGAFVPPYDTAETLTLLERLVERHRPARVVCLGDSFHDRAGAAALPDIWRDRLQALMRGRDWVWIAGNHDPDDPVGLGGETARTARFGSLTLRHEPTGASGEIGGHLHPVLSIAGGRGRSRNACFLNDGERLIMPAFGITTGGLSVRHDAFDPLIDRTRATAFAIGLTRIVPVALGALAGAPSARPRALCAG